MTKRVLIVGKVSDEAAAMVAKIIGVRLLEVQREERRRDLNKSLAAGVVYQFDVLITSKDIAGGNLHTVMNEVGATCAISISTDSSVHHVEARDCCASIRLTAEDMVDDDTARKVAERLAFYTEGVMPAWPAEFVNGTLAGAGSR